MKSVNLWSQKLTNYQLYIYDTIKLLRGEGLYYYEISHILNDHGFKSVRGKKFNSGIVHSTEWKIDKNLNRLTTTYFSEIKNWDIIFEEDYGDM